LWGAQANKALNAQRADLWTMDLSNVVRSLNTQISTGGVSNLTNLQLLQPYFVQSVSLPELKVNAEPYRRDSRPYMMPVFDEPLGAITARFYLETPTSPQGSVVYHLMDTWRAFVRGGRGAYTREGNIPKLDANFQIQYAFNASLTLYRGCTVPEIIDYFTGVGQEYYGDKTAFIQEVDGIKDPDLKIKRLNALRTSAGLFDDLGVKNDLEMCGLYSLEKMWLSSFKLTEFNYTQGNQLTLVEATFYADNIVDLSANTTNV
jgi:hypothetical protein